MEILLTIEPLLEEVLQEYPEVFPVDARVKPVNNFKYFLDADNGLSIEKCAAINRKLYKKIEEAGLFPNGDFSLEISSPGLDEPLKKFRQYLKNIGRQVDVILKDGRKITGMLKAATEDGIVLEETKGRGKKSEIVQHSILMEEIKSTVIVVSF